MQSFRFCFRARALLLLVFAASFFFLAGHRPPSHRQENLGETIASEKQYFAALAAADSAAFLREFEYSFVLLLHGPNKENYFKIRAWEERKAFVRAYWKSHNPNPLLPENDWLLDFIQRCSYVKQNFPSPQPPFFDDRGKYYLLHGKPWYRYTRQNDSNLLPNESWSYRKVTADFLVHFVGMADGSYREAPSLMDAIIGASSSDKAKIWAKLVHERAAVSPALARASRDVNELQLPQLYSRTYSATLTERILRVVQNHEYEVHEAIEEAPIATYNPIKADNRLAFSHSLAQFRAPNGRTRLEVGFLALLKKNLIEKFDFSSEANITIEFGGMLRDLNFDSLAATRQRRVIPVGLAAREGLSYAVGNLSLVCPPLIGELTLQVQDTATEKVGYEQKPFTIRDFHGQNLMISDIEFLAEPANANQRRLLPTIKKLDVELASYPHPEMRKSIPMFCYFEIYNLKTAGVAEAYEITYRMITGKSGSGMIKKASNWLAGTKDVAISVTLTRPVVDDTATELIAIDLSRVPKGVCRFMIIITAANNRNLAASAEKEITIVD